MMKRALIGVFVSFALLLGISSCATVPTGPLGEDEMRLLKMSVPENGSLRLKLTYSVEISFEANGHPEINRVVCYCGGEGLYFYRIRDVRYGSPGSFTVDFSMPEIGSQRLECYADYIRGGKKQRTNPVFAHVLGIS